MRRAGRRRLLSWAGLALLWVALVGTGETRELVAGLIAASIGVVASETLVRAGLPTPVAGGRAWRHTARTVLRVPLESALVLAALARGSRGSFGVSPLPRGRDWRRHGERGVGALAGSIAPNTIVVDVDAARRLVLWHRLVPEDRDPLA